MSPPTPRADPDDQCPLATAAAIASATAGERVLVALPTLAAGGLEDRVAEHFGRAPTFTLYDTVSEAVRVVRIPPAQADGAESCGSPAERLAQEGVELVLCGDLGADALHRLALAGIGVRARAHGTVRQALQQWLDWELHEPTEASACRHLHARQ